MLTERAELRRLPSIVCAIELRLLSALGVLGDLTRCGSCGEALSAEAGSRASVREPGLRRERHRESGDLELAPRSAPSCANSSPCPDASCRPSSPPYRWVRRSRSAGAGSEPDSNIARDSAHSRCRRRTASSPRPLLPLECTHEDRGAATTLASWLLAACSATPMPAVPADPRAALALGTSLLGEQPPQARFVLESIDAYALESADRDGSSAWRSPKPARRPATSGTPT